ncbi:hypothetical protein CTI12_AA034120 [Artemisia annua]|uniref:Uncharacterized protein n=1 Tax=Artemisia annua TaxID=35608 RepID=A0A2U1PZ97_ARTAN|nr:hypothetical protein CTI12_AA034120 [Artemisia annua]
MPMYVMNLFLLPDVLIDEIHHAFNRFWWGHGNKENPIRWASWESMCISKDRGGLGFRHMNGFNKALLAKQGWRLITMDGSLSARILKARYFPRGCFLDARIGHKPSFIWRSLCSARYIIRKGQRWNVGNGMKVRIWEDNWLEGYKTLHNNHPQDSEYNVVNDLLDSATQRWNHTLLLQLFSRQIATRISCVHTNPAECDFFYWDASPNGVFTCKSAYWIAIQSMDRLQQSQHERKYLKAVWLANVPGEVKIFVWRACMNLVPTINNLVTRGLVPNSFNCIHCSTPMEDVKHALFLCDWARDIWVDMELSDLTNQVADISIEEMLGATKESKNDLDKNIVKQSAYGMLQEFSRVNQPTEAFTAPHNAPSRAWSAPTYGVIKINCDAGVLGNNGVSGLGFVMRNHNGLVLLAGSKRLAFTMSVVEAEAKAILWAIQEVQAKGFAKVVLETDSSILVDAFKHNKVLYHIKALFLHIRRLCLLFDSCTWSFVRRDGNKAAHELAGLALTDNVDVLYDGYVPLSVQALVQHDVNLIVD